MSRSIEEQDSAKSRGERPNCGRREGCTIHHLDATEVIRFNQEIGSTGVARPNLSDVIAVFNVPLEECYLVLFHEVNRRPTAVPRVDQLLRLSERQNAPYRGSEVWLRTPAYYRRIESPGTKPTDPHDGFLTKDATSWMRRALTSNLGLIENVNATMTFSSHQEPWVYCTSIPPTNEAGWRELRERFHEYDAMTVIRDPNCFAVQLGIDFAVSVQESTHVDLSPMEKWAYEQSSYAVPLWEGKHRIDKIIRVYHGPVVYEDQSGVLGSVEEVVDSSMVPRGWFTKKKGYSREREYRFAVSTLGKPREDTFKLRISDELRRLTTKA